MADTVEVNARELEELKRLALSGQVAEKVWKDPKYGTEFKSFVKKVIPEADIPELDAMNHANQAREDAFTQVDAVKKELAELREERKKEREEEKIQREEAKFAMKIDEVRKKSGFTDEGMNKVFARMKEHNNPDIESAAAYVRSMEPKVPTQNSYAPQMMDLYGSNSGDKEWEDLNKNPVGWFDKMATEILNDPQYN